VNGEIDAVFKEGFFNFLRKHALGANLGQSNVGDLVAGRLDDFQLHRVTLRA
jgi:hypothetical protein